MTNIFYIFQIILAIVVTGLILLQQKGTGLSSVFGGEGNVYRTKRGAERIIFIATIVSSFLFFGLSLLSVIFS